MHGGYNYCKSGKFLSCDIFVQIFVRTTPYHVNNIISGAHNCVFVRLIFVAAIDYENIRLLAAHNYTLYRLIMVLVVIILSLCC